MNRLHVTARLLAATIVIAAAASAGSADEENFHHPRRSANDVLLVHGAWADGSSWSAVIEHLQREGFTVQALQLRNQSLADDVALVRHAIDRIGRPVVVTGHSYGGAVMSGATAGASNVVGLVFISAFALDQGESLNSVSAGYPPGPAVMHLVIDDQGNATIDPPAFVRYFAPDVPRRTARVLAAVQHPLAASILKETAGVPGWRQIPTFFVVSANDDVINPDLERFFAQRMGAYTVELQSSHASLVSHPHEVAELIERACQ
jgi:pimeloyl-ACP methyl ester carboxylesterase